MAATYKNKSRKMKENQEEIKDGLSGRIIFPLFEKLSTDPQVNFYSSHIP